MTSPEMKKAPALSGVTGAIRTETIPLEGNETMNTIQAQAADNFSTYNIATGNARISIESDRDYWQNDTLPNRVRLTDNADAHLLLSPAEALSISAALTAVAVHLMEQDSAEGVAA